MPPRLDRRDGRHARGELHRLRLPGVPVTLTVIRVEKTGAGVGVIVLKPTDGADRWRDAWAAVEGMVVLGWTATIRWEGGEAA